MAKAPKHPEAAGGSAEDAARVSPEATGVAPDARILGSDEIRALLVSSAELEETKTRLLRVQADLENFRRREAQERRRAVEDEADRALAPVLDALDTFTRAVESAEAKGDMKVLLDGLNLAFRELERRLGEAGVTRIEGVGQAFDPSTQAAMLQEPTADHPPMTVLQVLSHGWRRGGRVLRPARVKVAAAPPEKGPGAEGKG
jgi:molecular chaperone GrpE